MPEKEDVGETLAEKPLRARNRRPPSFDMPRALLTRPSSRRSLATLFGEGRARGGSCRKVESRGPAGYGRSMTKDQLESVLEDGGATKSGAEWKVPEGVGISFHVSRGGAGLTVAKVTTVRLDKTLVLATGARGDRHAFDLADLVVTHVEGGKGEAPRRAGF